MKKYHICASHEDWLSLRKRDLTSTDVAALFGLSPYLTEYELWHRKRNQEDAPKFEANERVLWGQALENTIAKEFARRNDWNYEEHIRWGVGHLCRDRFDGWSKLKGRPVVMAWDTYHRDSEERIGASFDFRLCMIDKDQAHDEIIEIKNVDARAYASKWIERDGELVEAPPHIELQVQQQMLVSDAPAAWIVALVGGNELRAVRRLPDPEVHAVILKRARDFWASIEADEPPQPDYARDYDRLVNARLHEVGDDTIDADDEINAMLDRVHDAQKRKRQAETEERELKARILERVGTASKVRAAKGTLSCGVSKPTTGKIITEDMVGTYMGARSSYRVFRFTPTKAKP